MIRFVGDTVHILALIVLAAFVLAVNLALVTLNLGIQAINAYVSLLIMVGKEYGGSINKVLHPGAPKGVTIQ